MTEIEKKYIRWADEHYHSFMKLRESDLEEAEAELKYLKDCLDKLMAMQNIIK